MQNSIVINQFINLVTTSKSITKKKDEIDVAAAKVVVSAEETEVVGCDEVFGEEEIVDLVLDGFVVTEVAPSKLSKQEFSRVILFGSSEKPQLTQILLYKLHRSSSGKKLTMLRSISLMLF